MAELIYGLLGRKLAHSWSVPIHKALGCENYRLIELEPEQLGEFLQQREIGGLNVTLPYKRTVMQYCDVIDEAAQAIGSVNTIVRKSDGKLHAYNTDAAGFIWMVQRAKIDFTGKKAVVLGSGGASLTAQAMAAKLGAREVVVISRSGENNYDNLSRHADAGIVINTTPVGMYPDIGKAAVDLRSFPNCTGVLDLIYNPRRTALILQAEVLGIRCSDGLPMLVAQAVAAEERFFDLPIPAEENDRILKMLRRDFTNIVLIGMPGCGKTTTGEILGRITGREVVDIDAEIVKWAGKSIPEIFAENSEAGFRAFERVFTDRFGAQPGRILVTGGGVVKNEQNYAALHQNGRIYHLRRRVEALERAGRPLSTGVDLPLMAVEREPLYARFRDAEIDNNGSVEDAAEAIWRDFNEYSGN